MDHRLPPDIGTRLKLAREKKGLSLEQVFEITRIQPAILKGIEEGNADLSPVLLRGFIKTYAETLGWDVKGFFKKAPLPENKKEHRPKLKKPGIRKKGFPIGYSLALFFVCLIVGFGLISLLKKEDSPKKDLVSSSATPSSSESQKSLQAGARLDAGTAGSSPFGATAASPHLNEKPRTTGFSGATGSADATSSASAIGFNTRKSQTGQGGPAGSIAENTSLPLSRRIGAGGFKEEALIFSQKSMNIYFTVDNQALVTKALQPSVWFAIKARHKIYLRFDENLGGISLFYNGRPVPIPEGDFFERLFP